MKLAAPALFALLLLPGLVAAVPFVPWPEVPALGSIGAGGVGVTVGPKNIIVAEPGYTITPVIQNLRYPTALAFRGANELLVLESGRYVYADPYAGQDKGNLTAYTLDAHGNVLGTRRIATRLADPLGLTLGPDGDAWVSEFGRVSRIPAAWLGGRDVPRVNWSWGYPDQTSDAIFLPVTGEPLQNPLHDPIDGSTTGPMGIAIRASDGQPFVAVAAHGRPPDDDGIRDVTGLDYDNPYSSSVMAPTGGAISVEQRAARACRNCYDLAFAPPGRDDAGTLYITENNGPYRLRLFSGSNRSILTGSTVADVNLLDGVDKVDPATGHVHRVATFRPDLLGVSPTGIAFAPASFQGHANDMFVALFSGFFPPLKDKGGIDHVIATDDVTGVGLSVPFVLGLDFPTDLTFGPDGAMYVVEYYSGTVWRIAHDAS